jgi:CHASE3 domain sensor protein
MIYQNMIERIRIAVIISVLLLVVISAAVLLWNRSQLSDLQASVNETVQAGIELTNYRTMANRVCQVEAHERDFLLTGNGVFLSSQEEELLQTVSDVQAAAVQADELPGDWTEHIDALTDLSTILQETATEFREEVATRRDTDMAGARGRLFDLNARRVANEGVSLNSALLRSTNRFENGIQEIDTTFTDTNTANIVLLALLLVLGGTLVGGIYYVSQYFIAPLSKFALVASALEADRPFDPAMFDELAGREDEIGVLARHFQRVDRLPPRPVEDE